jgi:hypothetical protein
MADPTRAQPTASEPRGEDWASTCEQDLLEAPSHTLLLRAVQAHAGELATALQAAPRADRSPSAGLVLRAVKSLPDLDAQTRLTLDQVLSFLGRLTAAPLPRSYAAALRLLQPALAAARHPIDVLLAVGSLRESPGAEVLRPGLSSALALLGHALESGPGMTPTCTVFGQQRATEVARACARGSVWGALAGSLCGIGPGVASVVGAIAASAQAAMAIALTPQHA